MFAVWAIALVVAVTIHEFAHAWTAVKLGDPTPRLQGRLTLNPIAHLDPIGTLMLLLVRFGWGKPVQFDPFNLENPRRDAAVISLAGPASNLLTASIVSIVARFILQINPSLMFLAISNPSRLSLAFQEGVISSFDYFGASLSGVLISLSVILAIFNLIPIHPLDGGKILVGLLPAKDAAMVDLFLRKYGIFILLILVFPLFGPSPVFAILSPIINLLLDIYIPIGPIS